MKRKGFFDAIYNTCKNDSDKVIELLLTRGFLLDFVDGVYCLSDNSHKSDTNYLKKILEKYEIGTVVNGRIVINNPSRYSMIEREFRENTVIDGEAGDKMGNWDYFKQRQHGFKAPVNVLEPFIGRYVKALSSAGVTMIGSCDGNHPHSQYFFLQYRDCGSPIWHMLICEVLERNNFYLEWIEGRKLYFDSSSKYDTYYKLNEAAKFVYENRKIFRSIKQSALENYSYRMLRSTDSKLIEDSFTKEARKLLIEKFD